MEQGSFVTHSYPIESDTYYQKFSLLRDFECSSTHLLLVVLEFHFLTSLQNSFGFLEINLLGKISLFIIFYSFYRTAPFAQMGFVVFHSLKSSTRSQVTIFMT